MFLLGKNGDSFSLDPEKCDEVLTYTSEEICKIMEPISKGVDLGLKFGLELAKNATLQLRKDLGGALMSKVSA